MKRNNMMMLGIAGVAGLGAAFLASQYLKPRRQIVEKEIGTVEILVASKDINLGNLITSSQLRWKSWPKAATQGFITRTSKPNALTEYSKAIARAPFLKDEPIRDQKLIKAHDGGVLAAILPSGMRAISTPIRESSAAGGFILPNDRVDVILSRRVKQGGGSQFVSETVLTNVKVLAIGDKLEVKDGKKVSKGKLATFELSAKNAKILQLSKSLGEISLALRSLSNI